MATVVHTEDDTGDISIGYSCTSVFWKIEEFFSLPQDVGYKIRSPSFEFMDEEWYFIMYPNGGPSQSIGYVGLYLANCSSDTPNRNIQFKMSVWNEDDTELISVSYKTDFHPTVPGWGTDVFIQRSRLVWQKAQFAPEGCLTVFCKLIVPDIDETKPKEVICTEVEKLSEDFKDMFVSEELSDITVTVRGRKFKCHRVVLAARSPVFAAMLKQEMQERATGLVEIEDCEPEAFQEFLIYLYSGSMDDFTVKNAFDLYRIADKYDTPRVKVKSVHMLANALSVKNFCNIVKLTLQYEESKLLMLAEMFFAENTRKILLTASWQNFLKENPTAANEFYVKSLDMKELLEPNRCKNSSNLHL